MNTRRSIGRISAVGVTLTATITVLAATSGPASAATVSASAGATKYVNCFNGSDRNSGTKNAPLRTVAKATSDYLAPGTSVLLARNCSWDGAVWLGGDGSSSAPITLGAYGTGTAPVLTGKYLGKSDSIVTLSGRYQQLKDVHLSQARTGYGVSVQGSNDLVSNVEIDRVGTGVIFSGPYSKAYKTRVHDLSMIQNTPGGDDDYGALGFNVMTNDIEISYSDCTNCNAPSYDYGSDGGFVEIWNYGDRLNVHDNTSRNTNGIMEVGGTDENASASDIRFTNNTFKASVGGFYFHNSTQFAMPVWNVNVSGNRIFGSSSNDTEIFGGNIESLHFDRNIVKTPGQVTWSGTPGGSHTCNYYSVSSPDSVGYDLDSSERVVTNGSIPAALPAGC